MYLEQLNNTISTQDAIVVYFSGENCSVCKILKPKIQEILENQFPKIQFIEIKSEDYKETCAQYHIFSIPTIITFLDGKEFSRYGRNISIAQFAQNLKRPYDLFFN
ncbi:MAG: thioredoxin family protein [Campylobacterales bacterium]|nr:thioredoxin family protein [Campylobacterales bacterium]